MLISKVKQKMFGKLEAELDQKEAEGNISKVEHFLVKVLPNIVAGIAIFLGMIWIFNQILEKYGLDRIVVVFGVIIILLLRSINKTLNQVS